MEGPVQKWECSASSKLHGVKPDQAWSLLIDNYYNMHKHFPSVITSCRNDNGIRHSTASLPGKPTIWYKDRLVKMDHTERSYTYEVFENSGRSGKVVGTIKVLPDGGDSSVIEWSGMTEPSEGWNSSEYASFVQAGAAEIAKTIGDVVRAGTK